MSTRFEERFFQMCGCDEGLIKPCAGAKIEEVIIIYVIRGNKQTGEPFREVTQVWSKDGRFIAERDPLSMPFTGSVETDTAGSES